VSLLVTKFRAHVHPKPPLRPILVGRFFVGAVAVIAAAVVVVVDIDYLVHQLKNHQVDREFSGSIDILHHGPVAVEVPNYSAQTWTHGNTQGICYLYCMFGQQPAVGRLHQNVGIRCIDRTKLMLVSVSSISQVGGKQSPSSSGHSRICPKLAFFWLSKVDDPGFVQNLPFSCSPRLMIRAIRRRPKYIMSIFPQKPLDFPPQCLQSIVVELLGEAELQFIQIRIKWSIF
jgi:hypothetical protein